MCLVPLLIWGNMSVHAQIVAGEGEFTSNLKRSIGSYQTEKALKIDVDGDGVWDYRVYGVPWKPTNYPKSTSYIFVEPLHDNARACRYYTDYVSVPFNKGDTCLCDVPLKKRWTDAGGEVLLGSYPWTGPQIWPKLSNRYIAIRLDVNGEEVFGWLKFTQYMSPNAFWFALYGIGVNATGWTPAYEVEEYIPPAQLEQYEDVFIPEIIPPDTTDQGGDTTIIEPPPPPPLFVDSTFQAYPNPFSDELTVNLLDVKDIKRVELINFNGLTVYQQTLYKAEIVKIPSADLPPGPYILRVVRYAHPPMMLRVVHIYRKE